MEVEMFDATLAGIRTSGKRHTAPYTEVSAVEHSPVALEAPVLLTLYQERLQEQLRGSCTIAGQESHLGCLLGGSH